jgi:hypothetical protein
MHRYHLFTHTTELRLSLAAPLSSSGYSQVASKNAAEGRDVRKKIRLEKR